MSENSVACPKCGASVSADAAHGLCPKCLLQQASFPTEATGGPRLRPDPPRVEALTAAFPHLEILELIGRGGMGFVFKARQPKLDRLVALKILAETLSADPSFAERFTREARALARLNHPNIVTIHDFGQAGPFFYLLMEFVDGVNLRQAMLAKQVSATEALAIVPKICEALQYAHSEGILHRDIKPDNILLDAKGRVKIADFGIAKLLNQVNAHSALTESGATLGTVHYMAPEQIERPNEVDHRADIYSLGVVFYEMLTGELPIGRFPPPSEKSPVDPRLDKVVFKTLAKEPAKRPQSAGELGTEVETISQPGKSPAREEALRSVPLNTATRCYISTPEHLRTFFGWLFIYTGRGQLGLEADRLMWSHEYGATITIPLESIVGLALGEFSRVTKPTGLNYIAVTWRDGTQDRRILLVPNQGPFSLTWNTNRLVQEWFTTIRERVSALTGRAPSSGRELCDPLPGVRTPRYAPVLGKMAALIAVAFFSFFLLTRLLIHKPVTYDAPQSGPTMPVVTSYSPTAAIPSPHEAGAGEPSITLDYVQGNPASISVDSKSEFEPDGKVQAVIAYARGPWAPSAATTESYRLYRESTNRVFSTSYSWFLPQGFASAFDVNAELQRITSSFRGRPLALTTNIVFEIFSLTNKDGQVISGGLQLVVNRPRARAGTDAVLRNFRADSQTTTEANVDHVFVNGSFVGAVPEEFRIESFLAVDGIVNSGSTSWTSSQPGLFNFSWPSIPFGYELKNQILRLETIHVPTNAPIELVAFTNVWRANARVRVAGTEKSQEAKTNIVRGFVQLVPIPVNGRAVTE